MVGETGEAEEGQGGLALRQHQCQPVVYFLGLVTLVYILRLSLVVYFLRLISTIFYFLRLKRNRKDRLRAALRLHESSEPLSGAHHSLVCCRQ